MLAGYGESDFDVDARASSGEATSYHIGLYGGGALGSFLLKAGAVGGFHDVSAYRSVNFTGISDQLSSGYEANTFQAFGEVSRRYAFRLTSVEPFVNLAHVILRTENFTESGGASALTLEGETTNATFTTLGLKAFTEFGFGGGVTTLSGMVGWRHVFAEDPSAAVFFASGSDQFTTFGTELEGDAIVVETGLDVRLAEGTNLGFNYAGQFGSDLSGQSARAGLEVKF